MVFSFNYGQSRVHGRAESGGRHLAKPAAELRDCPGFFNDQFRQKSVAFLNRPQEFIKAEFFARRENHTFHFPHPDFNIMDAVFGAAFEARFADTHQLVNPQRVGLH